MIEVEIWSDILCPFCYIGKRNFEKAVSHLPKDKEFKVAYRSFELDSKSTKSQNVNINEMLAKKYGKTVEWAEEMNANMVRTASAAGLSFNMDKIIPTNSFDAHRLLHLAAKNNLQDKTKELLFAAYFTEGKDIADANVLAAIGEAAGLQKEVVLKMLASDEQTTEVRADEETAFQMGVTGVPFFVFNREFFISGAQPPEAFVEAISKIK